MASDPRPSCRATETAAPEPEILNLRTQLVSAGPYQGAPGRHRTHDLPHPLLMGRRAVRMACTPMSIEDHLFVVLQGEAQFYGGNGALPALKKEPGADAAARRILFVRQRD